MEPRGRLGVLYAKNYTIRAPPNRALYLDANSLTPPRRRLDAASTPPRRLLHVTSSPPPRRLHAAGHAFFGHPSSLRNAAAWRGWCDAAVLAGL